MFFGFIYDIYSVFFYEIFGLLILKIRFFLYLVNNHCFSFFDVHIVVNSNI